MELIKIQNRKNFVHDIKIIHPDDPRYVPYWFSEKKKVIEGDWVYDNGGWRFIPPKLYFAVNHGSLIYTNKEDKTRFTTRPYLTDLFWEMGYLSFESLGFSGYEDSDYTSDLSVFELQKNWNNVNSLKHAHLFKSNGQFKDFIPVRENIRMLHNKSQGVPLYRNEPKNYITMGSRGGGKSYWVANGEILHELVTDGLKKYNREVIEQLRDKKISATLLVGSGDSGKSSELCTKVLEAMNMLGASPMLGVYGKLGDDDYTPSLFYKDMIGDISPNNKDNPYRHQYKKRTKGQEQLGGSGSELHHVVYSEMSGNKKGGQKGAGGRYNISVTEEIGLTPLVREAWRSNEATVQTDGFIFGRQVFIGTSENIEAVQPAKEMMTNPRDYRLVEFEDEWEHTGKIGFFIPAYLTLEEFKDENGNTNVEKAKAFLEKRREEKAKAANPDILKSEKLNYPVIPSEMWLGTRAKLLPYEEAAHREKELMSNNLYQKIGKPIKLRWDSSHLNDVAYEIDNDAKPIWEYPITNLTSIEGCPVVYDFPQLVNGEIPKDMYIYTHDPYISDNLDEGGSLGSTQIWLNPKYWNEYCTISPLVASYLGKAKNGKEQYYENQEKLIAMYGNCPQMFYYEANRGEDCYYYYVKRKKAFLLAPRPVKSDSNSMFMQTTTKFGFIVGSRTEKINKLDDFGDLLLQDIDNLKKKFIETIPDIYLIREIMAYDLNNGNFDAVSSCLGFPIAIKEIELNTISTVINKNNKVKNTLGFLSVNPNIFKTNEDNRNKRKLDKYSQWIK